MLDLVWPCRSGETFHVRIHQLRTKDKNPECDPEIHATHDCQIQHHFPANRLQDHKSTLRLDEETMRRTGFYPCMPKHNLLAGDQFPRDRNLVKDSVY